MDIKKLDVKPLK